MPLSFFLISNFNYMLIDNFGGRKFVFAMFVVGCGLWLALVNTIDFGQFMNISIWAFGIFSVSNAVEHLGDGKK